MVIIFIILLIIDYINYSIMQFGEVVDWLQIFVNVLCHKNSYDVILVHVCEMSSMRDCFVYR